MRHLLFYLTVLLMPAISGAQTIYFSDMWDDDFPPLLLNKPEMVVELQDSIDIPERWKQGYGKFFISKTGNVDSVLCFAPVHSTEKLESFCGQATFGAGVGNNWFINMELEFYLRFIDFHPTTKAEITFVDSQTYRHEDGRIEVRPLYDEHEYNKAYRNAIFNRDFPKNLGQNIEYVDFNIVVDTIRKINKSGDYHIPDREGYSLRIQPQGGDEHFLLMNIRRNRLIVLDNPIVMNLEKDDDYLLLCQKNQEYDTKFYIAEFTLTENLSVDPLYKKMTHQDLRERITTKWGKRNPSSH